MIQGGGYDAKLIERPARQTVPHEGRQAYQAGLRNVSGSIAMARTNDPDSAAAQFFIKAFRIETEFPRHNDGAVSAHHTLRIYVRPQVKVI